MPIIWGWSVLSFECHPLDAASRAAEGRIMSILIRGMEMPTSCHVCVAGFGGLCYLGQSLDECECPDNGRPDWCPLVEIPQHGRLIDIEAPLRFEVAIDAKMHHTTVDIYAPTVISAEEAEE